MQLLSPARRRLWLLLAVTLLLAACGTPTGEPLKPLKRGAVVLALGDSLTHGTGGGGVSYPQQLEIMIGSTVINAGIPGDTSAGARARTAHLLQRHKPQLVILCIGGNDFLQRQNADETKANISAIVQMVKDAGVDIVLVAVPRVLPIPVNHSLYREVASEHDLWLEDESLKTVLHDNNLKSDQIHANAAGYRAIAEAIADLLRRAGAVN